MSIFYSKKCNGIEIPCVGLGTWKINDKEIMHNVIKNAYDFGYRLFDTAASYTNEIVFGNVIKDIGIRRDDVIVTDKVWNTNRGYENTKNALKTSLKKLKMDYIDIYLIHWPASMALYNNWKEINAETWRAMEDLLREGLTRIIGVCNYKTHHLEELKKTAKIIPMINQIEYHPGYIQDEIVKYCNDNNILVEASSPLSNGELLSDKVLLDVAQKYNKSVGQITLKWAIQNGAVVIPKTVKKERLKENIKIFDFDIEREDIERINHIKQNYGMRIDSDKVVEFG